jgi:3-hydroxyethyl bacteriochlorophyllide a dehydrogenase
MIETEAVIIKDPGKLYLGNVALREPATGEVVVETHFSGVSTGTERLFWNGEMPTFPGMGYPLVPGYEAVGEVVDARGSNKLKVGDFVFVPGANCYKDLKGLFGASARQLIVAEEKLIKIDKNLDSTGTLFALAATARHAMAGLGNKMPNLIVGHGVLGRLLARLTIAAGGEPPVVWETNSSRISGAEGYEVLNPVEDNKRDYESIYDASGDPSILDQIIQRLKKNGEIVLAGFYSNPLTFTFPPAFMREAKIRISAEFTTEDVSVTKSLIETGALSLDNLISDTRPAEESTEAYKVAFEDSNCLKMVIDWRNAA